MLQLKIKGIKIMNSGNQETKIEIEIFIFKKLSMNIFNCVEYLSKIFKILKFYFKKENIIIKVFFL